MAGLCGSLCTLLSLTVAGPWKGASTMQFDMAGDRRECRSTGRG